MMYSLNIAFIYMKFFFENIMNFNFSENFHKANIHSIKVNIDKINFVMC